MVRALFLIEDIWPCRSRSRFGLEMVWLFRTVVSPFWASSVPWLMTRNELVCSAIPWSILLAVSVSWWTPQFNLDTPLVKPEIEFVKSLRLALKIPGIYDKFVLVHVDWIDIWRKSICEVAFTMLSTEISMLPLILASNRSVIIVSVFTLCGVLVLGFLSGLLALEFRRCNAWWQQGLNVPFGWV